MSQAGWRWLWDRENGIGRDDRQHLLAELKEAFDEKLAEFNECEICLKYPQYASHLEKSYANMNFLPKMDKVEFGGGASEQKINFCLKWPKMVQMGPKGSQMVKNT